MGHVASGWAILACQWVVLGGKNQGYANMSRPSGVRWPGGKRKWSPNWSNLAKCEAGWHTSPPLRGAADSRRSRAFRRAWFWCVCVCVCGEGGRCSRSMYRSSTDIANTNNCMRCAGRDGELSSRYSQFEDIQEVQQHRAGSAKMEVKRPQGGVKWRPEWPPGAPSWPPNGPKLASTWAKLGPSWFKLGPSRARLAQVSSTWPQVGPRWPKLAPSRPQMGSMLAQAGPKLAPCWPHVGPSWPQVGPKLGSSWLKVTQRSRN